MTVLRDWWRGWSDDDLANVLTKIALHGADPGALILVSRRELAAHLAYRLGYRLDHKRYASIHDVSGLGS